MNATRTSVLRTVAETVAPRASGATVDRVTIGDSQLLVELTHPRDGDVAGVAHRPAGERSEPLPDDGAGLATLATAPDSTRLQRAVGIATLNALSAPEMSWRAGDPMERLPASVSGIATIGLFRPAFVKFGDIPINVIERDPSSVGELPTHATAFPPDDLEAALAGVDVCFVTGSTLVYGGLRGYLSTLRRRAPMVVVIGATASFLPGPLFDAGVDVLAGARVTDPDGVREGIVAGACGTELHDVGLEKVYVTEADWLSGRAIDPTAPFERHLGDRSGSASDPADATGRRTRGTPVARRRES